ncbi:MAG: hypothetical protein A7315_05595 [Candidatus Altiarchaeales archaeon WOR_SM1_79]|nr:MAG: hypothetical protein A7315_05595 [Candidatus Altiarchaeales archaeon WOR_SM1_79]
MAGILIIAGLSLYGFIDQQQVNIQQVEKEMYIQDPTHLRILHVMFFLSVVLDAVLFTFGITFVICIFLNGMYIAEIFVDKKQDKLYLLATNFFRAGFVHIIEVFIVFFYATPFIFLVMVVLPFWPWIFSNIWIRIIIIVGMAAIMLIFIKRHYKFLSRLEGLIRMDAGGRRVEIILITFIIFGIMMMVMIKFFSTY